MARLTPLTPRSSWFDRILASFVKPKPVPYRPAFSVVPEARGFAIFDHGRQLGRFNTEGWFYLDLWRFAPTGPDVYANAKEHPHVHDMHTGRNSNLNLPVANAADLFAGVADPHAAMRVSWPQRRGDRLRLVLEGRFAEGQRLRYELRLTYDPAWGRYRCFLDADAWKLKPDGFEPVNFMMVGALRGWTKSRWSHSVYEDAAGRLRRLVHSNALFGATDYACPSGTWRSKRAPFSRSWIAYAPNATCNPAMLVHACNVPLYFATCSALFDEHLVWDRATIENLQGNHFHFQLRTEFVNLGQSLATELLNGASDPPRPRRWRVRRTALPLRLGQVNHLEAPVDVWAEEDCPLLLVEDNPRAAVQWVRGPAHSGRHSLRFTSTKPSGWTRLFPTPAVCEVRPGGRYRFSAWVKTAGVERFARLELASFEYTQANKINIAQSRKVGGDRRWTRLSVELDTDDAAYMLPTLELYGTGTAWFDDLLFERIR